MRTLRDDEQNGAEGAKHLQSATMSEHTDPDRPPADRGTGVPLEDGVYDALVLDAEEVPDGGTVVELTITAGEHKGEVLSLASTTPLGDPIDLLGTPATVTVTFGTPSVRFDH
mgnify:CR=1 FL=1